MKPNSQFDLDASHDELDRLLDKVLARHAAVEARAGLEERVLANLRAEHPPVADRAWWRWGFVASAAVVVVVAFLAWRTTGPLHPVVLNHRMVEMQPVPTDTAQFAKPAKENNPPRPHSAKKHRHSRAMTVAADPKLDVFPSPQPLTEEELALAQYVRNFPGDAKLVAQAQQTSDTEILRKMQALANESADSN